MFKKQPCPVCLEKDARLADSEKTISFLKSLVYSPQSSAPSLEALEADAVLTGHQHPVAVTPEEAERLREENAERDRVLSGTY